MKTKRIFGYIFIVLAVMLSLAFIGMLPSFIATTIGLINIIIGNTGNYESGYIFGQFVAQLTTFGLTFLLWYYGLQWKRLKNKS